jgi:acyl carrier protein
MAMSRDEVFQKVEAVLVDALGVDEDEVTEDATLTGDLGAESIDFLDIVFRLEKSFEIKIPRGELFPDDILNNPDYVENGRMTSTGLQQLKKSMPHADFAEFEKDPSVSRMPDLFTVKAIVDYVGLKLEQSGKTAGAAS